jgi:hypothetical protein
MRLATATAVRVPQATPKQPSAPTEWAQLTIRVQLMNMMSGTVKAIIDDAANVARQGEGRR